MTKDRIRQKEEFIQKFIQEYILDETGFPILKNHDPSFTLTGEQLNKFEDNLENVRLEFVDIDLKSNKTRRSKNEKDAKTRSK